jgi:hypothetical protein
VIPCGYRRGPGGDAGSALLLVPAALLVLVVLGAVCVDSAAVFLGQRQLSNAAAAAAADGASALSDPAFYRSGTVALDPSAAVQRVRASLDAQSLGGLQLAGPPVVAVAGRQVCVSLTGRVRRIFASALPGFARSTTVHATAVATAAGDRGPGVPRALAC